MVGGAMFALDVDGADNSSAGWPRLDDEEEVLQLKINIILKQLKYM